MDRPRARSSYPFGGPKVWLIQLPLIAVWTLAFLVARCGDDGMLSSETLRTGVYPMLRRMEGIATDWKFRLRGARPVKQKIVIVEIDDRAIEMFGRWPWHRDAIAVLVQQVMDAGAKVVGLDIVFPEDDTRVPEGVAELLRAHSLGDEIPQFETDLMLQRIIDLNHDRLVLGWMADRWCRPAYPDDRPCPVTDKEELARLPKDFAKFAFAHFKAASGFDPATTVLASTPEILGNLPNYTASAKHAGYLVNAWEDSDNIVRRAQVALFVDGKPYPSLPLEMARVGLGDDLSLALDDRGRVERVELERSGLSIPVSPAGTLSINFRGPGYHFPFVGAGELLGEDDVISFQSDGKIDKKSRKDLFDGAYVFIGVTAIGARDLRNFPFGSNTPGTEGLATILDNVLSRRRHAARARHPRLARDPAPDDGGRVLVRAADSAARCADLAAGLGADHRRARAARRRLPVQPAGRRSRAPCSCSPSSGRSSSPRSR